MKNRILALLLALCLLLPLAASAAGIPTLPDLGAFAGDRLTPGDTEDFGFCQRVTLYGSKENVKLVAEAYVARLLKKYDICKHAHFTNFYDDGQSRRHYALGYVGEAEVGTVGYDDENEGWQISDAAIVLTYSQYNVDNYVMLTYCSEFNYKDTGDRIEASLPKNIPNAAPTPSTSTDAETRSVITQTKDSPSVATCTVCSGTGAYNIACSICQGAGVSSRDCTTCNGRSSNTCTACQGNKYTQCGSCDGHGSRSCSSCGGTGHHSSSHHGSSHHSSTSSKCSSCGGDGKRSCSSCSGSGKLNCRTCRAAGRKDCPDCLFGRISSVCNDCSGTGHRNMSCTHCNGTGIVK